MIDFRYHLVSIVSIFLALAVGIVLGAGPLQGDIGSTLTSEVTKLRTEKASLRSQLDGASKGIQSRDAFTQETNKPLLAGRLQGRSIAVIALPGADGAIVKTTENTLQQAGAKVTSTLTLKDAWTDPDPAKLSARKNLAQQLSGDVHVVTRAGPPDQLIDTVLAAAVLQKVPPGGAGQMPAAGTRVLDGLKGAGLISYGPDAPTKATGAVIIGAPVTNGNTAEALARATSSARLAGVVDNGSGGAVLASDVASDQASGQGNASSVVSAARKDPDIAKGLSTVDDAGAPIGQASIVLAMVEQYAGGSGQYGLAPDAKVTFPRLAPS